MVTWEQTEFEYGLSVMDHLLWKIKSVGKLCMRMCSLRPFAAQCATDRRPALDPPLAERHRLAAFQCRGCISPCLLQPLHCEICKHHQSTGKGCPMAWKTLVLHQGAGRGMLPGSTGVFWTTIDATIRCRLLETLLHQAECTQPATKHEVTQFQASFAIAHMFAARRMRKPLQHTTMRLLTVKIDVTRG